ncbi:MAG: DUF4623 domain-containing protein [Flavobacteriaceae bacterium]|nr:DUF4623 domain-containing protein [Flavobacteriaceae bacterium]
MINSKKTFVWVFAFLLAFAACEKDDPKSDEAFITGFTLAGVTATVSGSSITLSVPYGTDISSLSPTISNSLASTITPAAGTARNFGSPVTYTVTAEDGKTSNSYTVTVTVLDPDSVAIASFSIPDVDSSIDESAKTITVNVFEGTDVSALTPSITTIPADATLNLGGGTSLDLNSSVTITVSAGSKSESYTVSVNFLATGFDAESPVILFDAGATSNSLPPELGDTGDSYRGFSLSREYVYVAHKDDKEIYYWKIDGTSTSAGKLKKNDVVSGGWAELADVVATENGIVASNAHWNSDNDFKVYRWRDNDADPELILTYPNTWDGKNIRLGDNINFVGNPYGDGYLLVVLWGGWPSQIPNNNFVLIWDIENGSITNAETPRRIEFTELNVAGNYGYVEAVDDINDSYLLVNGANIVPTLYDLDGTQKLTAVESDAIPVRTFGGKIFEFNQKRYLAVATPGSEGGDVRDAAILVYDITGGSLVEAFNAINAENVESKLVLNSSFGQNVNGNQAADIDVFVDSSGERVVIMGGAANNGFQVIELKKAQ